MIRHSFDPVSAVLGVLAGVFAVLVMVGSLGVMSDDSVGIVALVALLIGIALIPWGLRQPPGTGAVSPDGGDPDYHA